MIRDAKDKLAGFHAEHSPKPADSPNGHRTHAEALLEDKEIIKLGRKAKNAPKFKDLFDRGDTSRYAGDDSAADQALVSLLAFYTQDPGQLDRLFRQSALCREKWTSRPDYRQRTIRYALDHPRRAGLRQEHGGTAPQGIHRPIRGTLEDHAA